MGTRSDLKSGGAIFPVQFKDEGFDEFQARIGKNFNALANKINAIGRRMAIGSLIAAAPIIMAVRSYAAYTKQLAFISTMLDDSVRYMDHFSSGIRKMSVEFGESTENLSRGLYDILSAGFAPAQALDMLAVTSKAAVAGMTDTKNSTQAIIAVLNSYSLSAEHAQEVSDSLFMTVRKGVLTFGELAGHIGMVSSTAAAAGVEMDEMGAVLATITRGGIETSHAVVALNNILKAFLSPTGASADFAKQLELMGLGPITTEGIKTKGFLNIMKEIAKLPPGMIAKLFPSIRGMRGIMALKANLASIDEIYSAWLNKAGATDEAFSKVAASFGFILSRLKEAGVLILSYFGEALSGWLERTVKHVINVAVGFGLWIKQHAFLARALATTVVIIGKIGVALMTVSAVLKILALRALIISALIGPKGWLYYIKAFATALAAFAVMEMTVRSVGTLAAEKSKEAVVSKAAAISPFSPKWEAANEALRGKKYSYETFQKSEKRRSTEDEIASSTIAKYDAITERIKRLKKEIKTYGNEVAFAWIKIRKLQVAGEEAVVKIGRYIGPSGERPIDPGINRRVREWEEIVAAGKNASKSVKDRAKYLESILKLDEKELKVLLVQQKVLKTQKDLEEAKLAAINSAAIVSKRGYGLGYYHTPVLAYSSTTEVNPELDALNQIAKNTESLASRDSGPSRIVRDLAKAIEEKVPN